LVSFGRMQKRSASSSRRADLGEDPEMRSVQANLLFEVRKASWLEAR
jgi:hypothetical protein